MEGEDHFKEGGGGVIQESDCDFVQTGDAY